MGGTTKKKRDAMIAPKHISRVRLIGLTQSSDAYKLRDFLQRSVVAFDWVELKDDTDCQRELCLSSLKNAKLPIVEFPDGTRLEAPTVKELAERLGWVTQPRLKEYDVSIYGAGPAGLSAAVYAASEGLHTVVIERHAIGGQAASSSLIENYMGFPGGISGAELCERGRQQAVSFGVEILMMREGVKAVFQDGKIIADLADGSIMIARTNICATGVEWRRLGLANEARYLGRGFYYGAGMSEAPLCDSDHVFVIGGANSAGQAAMHLTEYADKVTMLVRGPTLKGTMSAYLSNRILAHPKIEVRFGSEVIELAGESGLERFALSDLKSKATEWVDASRLFVCIGGSPNTEWAKDTPILRDASGFLLTGSDLLKEGVMTARWPLKRQPYHLETSVPGSFAVGDVRAGSVKRLATAVGEGSMAISFVHSYLQAAT
jgi:thioredoxin reductase (NADPH)